MISPPGLNHEDLAAIFSRPASSGMDHQAGNAVERCVGYAARRRQAELLASPSRADWRVFFAFEVCIDPDNSRRVPADQRTNFAADIQHCPIPGLRLLIARLN
jgi:hypothetical protein